MICDGVAVGGRLSPVKQSLVGVAVKTSSKTFATERMSATSSASLWGEVVVETAQWGGFSNECSGFMVEAMREMTWLMEVEGWGE